MSVTRLWNRFRATGWQGWAMLLVLAGGAFLRFYALGSESLWTDELSTLLHTRSDVLEAISTAVVKGTPPLYYLIQVLLRGVLPASEFGFRFVSAVADTVSVLLVYLVGRRVVGGPTAVLAAAVYATSIRAIWFAQEARAYSLSILLTLVVALALLRLIEQPTWRRAAVHGLAIIALLYTHVYAIFALVAFEFAVLISPRMARRGGRKWLASLGAAALAYLPWAMVLFRQATDRTEAAARGAWAIKAPDGFLGPILSSIAEFAPGKVDQLPYFGTTAWSMFVFPGLVILGVAGFAAFRRARSAPGRPAENTESSADFELTSLERRVFLGGWLVGIFAGGNLVSQHVLPIFTFRMATQAMPALALAAANGVRQLWKPAAVLLLAGLAVLSLYGLAPYYSDPDGTQREKEQWRDAIVYANEHAEDFDDILVTPDWHADHMIGYADFLGMDTPELIGVSRNLEDVAQEIRPVLSDDERVLVISSHVQRDDEGFSALERFLVDDPEWELGTATTLKGIQMREFVRIGSAP